MRITLLSFFLFLGGCATSQDFLPARPMPAASLDESQAISRIALGSCFTTKMPGEVFSRIAQQDPDVFVFMGDNVYAADEADDPALKSLREAYGELADNPDFARLRQQTPMLVTWDDHDMGLDDAGGDWPYKQFSESLFEHVWALPASAPVRNRPGVYQERIVGPPGQRVQFILLDTRFFRTPLTRHPDQDTGRYTPSADPDQNLLGDAQWQWLSEQLAKPAELRVVVTSIQMIADGHYWEAWKMMPLERERFYRTVRESGASNLVLVSGDRHSAAIYERQQVLDYPLFELTTSSLNLPLTTWVPDPVEEPGPHRLSSMYFEANHGLIDIDWKTREVVMRIIDENNHAVAQRMFSLDELQ